MNIEHLIYVGRNHLERFLPNLFQELQASDQLDDFLKSAAERTRAEMDSLISGGYREDEAWQLVRERYLILRPGDDEGGSERDNSNHTRGIFETIRELHDLQHEIEELTDSLPPRQVE